MILFNCGSWLIGFYLLWVTYTIILAQEDWDWNFQSLPREYLYLALFAGPPATMALFMAMNPFLLNPLVLGWPFHPPLCYQRNLEIREAQQPTTKNQVSSRALQRKMRGGVSTPTNYSHSHHHGGGGGGDDLEVGSVKTFSTNWNPNNKNSSHHKTNSSSRGNI